MPNSSNDVVNTFKCVNIQPPGFRTHNTNPPQVNLQQSKGIPALESISGLQI